MRLYGLFPENLQRVYFFIDTVNDCKSAVSTLYSIEIQTVARSAKLGAVRKNWNHFQSFLSQSRFILKTEMCGTELARLGGSPR